MKGMDYKQKYMELRTRYMADIDIAFRLGFEQGAQQSQQQQALDAQAKNTEMEHEQNMAEVGGMNGEGGPEGPENEGPPGQEGPEVGTPEAPPAPQAPEGGSELDQHIGKLEGMLGSSPDPEVKKSLEAILSLRKAEKLSIDMKKSDQAIKGIVKALHKPIFKAGTQAQHNMSSNAKQAVTMQQKIVDNIFKSWRQEENKAGKDIANILQIEGLIKE